MSKNPFELRAEMVQLAKDYMDKQYQMNLEFANDMYKQGLMQIEEVREQCKMYSIEEMMEKAKEMYSFVSNKE